MIHLSPAAIHELSRLRDRQSASDPQFCRILVQAGGCADFYYNLSFESQVNPSDQILDKGELQVIIDPQSLEYIDGLTLDYTEDLMGGSFRFHNPNAVRTCGCSHSFAVGDRKE